MINYLPTLFYSIIYFIACLLISKSESSTYITGVIFTSIILGLTIYYFYNKYKKNIASIVFSFHAIKNNMIIDSFKLPSSVIYRVRKNYDISTDDIKTAENDIKKIFKNKLDCLLYDKQEVAENIHPISYVFWNEFFKSGSIYQEFCLNTIGHFICPPFNEIKMNESKLNVLSPVLKMM